jgi:predicted AAA+ superfamily ATPase
VYHYRDSDGLEVDAIVEFPDGSWAAFEVKMGFGAQEDGARNLLKLAGRIDYTKTKKPSLLAVITANGFAYQRKDGVAVIPISVLTA